MTGRSTPPERRPARARRAAVAAGLATAAVATLGLPSCDDGDGPGDTVDAALDAAVDASGGDTDADDVPPETDSTDAATSDAANDGTAGACEAAVAASLETMRLTRSGARLLDDSGREVWLRGVNAGGRSKVPPFMPFAYAESGIAAHAAAPAFDDALAAYVDQAASWGIDVVRLPFSWEGVEPQRGEYDAEYLDRYRALISAFGEHDIRVIVDFHQDVFARPYCGDGFPIWAMPEADRAIEPRAFEDCEGWFQGYLGGVTPPKLAFDRFWADEDGLQDAFDQMWDHVVTSTRDLDAVVGYEIINEPHPGTAPAAAWGIDTLTPIYSRVGARITALAPHALVLFDGAGTDTLSATPTPGLPDGDTMVYAPHYYHPLVFAGGLPSGVAVDVETGIGGFARAAAAWGVPALVGEFGSRTATDEAAPYLAANYDAFDRHAMHATAWEFSRAPEDWNLEGFGLVAADGTETPSVAALVRIYPRAVAGEIDSFAYDADAGTAELRFTAIAGGVTELAAPARLFPTGATVTVEGVDGCGRYDAEAERIVVSTATAGDAVVRVVPE
ncbi:MAG: cellulase family glycosylhydrolase [Myxococcales bacterium]|nr:cellulase family glycosylhydrolase [Myxococcales bacterium]MCB9534289.1 cellulase family glycosylhydrolase [Myxococcales bacterium]